jgi:choline-glycine betaine transporter
LTVLWGVLAPLDLFYKVATFSTPPRAQHVQVFNSLFWGIVFWAVFTTMPFVISYTIGPKTTEMDQGGRFVEFLEK